MDLPSVKEFNSKLPIDIETPNGVVQLFPNQAQRGTGNQKWHLAIKGTVQTRVGVLEQCQVSFKGKRFEGHFTKAYEVNGRWSITFETVILVPEFWGGT